MKRERGIPFLLFVVCLVAAVPFSWGAGGLKGFDLARPGHPKVTLCHHPREDPANVHTIEVSPTAVPAHLAHGDSLGACPEACVVPSAVPKTGQTTCWGPGEEPYSSIEIDCAGTGQDGEYQRGVSVDARFTDNGDGTVKDNLTGLIWLKDASCLSYQVWYDALTVSNTLSAGNCGLTDGSAAGSWRLPNVRELQSLIDFGQFGPALPVGHPFSGVQFSDYWSSTANAYNPSDAWYVNLGLGSVNVSNKADAFSVWPVRGGP